MINQDPIYDQTGFSAQEPLFEPVTKLEPEPVPQEQVKAFRKKKGLIMIIVGVILLIIFIPISLALLLGNRQATQVITESTPLPSAAPVQQDDLTQRLSDLRDELTEADPTISVIPFPQVDMTMGITED